MEDFFKKALGILSILLILPFVVILFLAGSGAKDCISKIPDAFKDGGKNAAGVADAKECDPGQGKFSYMTRLGEITAKFYGLYIWIAVLLALVLSAAAP